MSQKSPAFPVSEKGKPSSKKEFDAQVEKWRKARDAFFADVEKRQEKSKLK